MKKLLFFLILAVLLISVILFTSNVSAANDVTLTGKKGTAITLPQECATCTFVKLSSIQFPNLSQTYINEYMTKNNASYYYQFSDTTQLGSYNYCGLGDVGGTNTTYCYDFTITYLGKQLTTEKAIIYFIFLILFVLIFIGTFIFIGFLPSRNDRNEEGVLMSISYLKYFRNVLYLFEWMLFIGIIYLFSNLGFAYLEEELFSKTLFTLFQVCLALTPVIITVWFVWILASIVQDKEFQSMINRGMMPGDII